MPNNMRLAAVGLVVLALLCALLLALLDWSGALLALGGLLLGAVAVLALEGGRWLYRTYRTYVLAGAAAAALALLVVLRPDGARDEGEPMRASSLATAYAAELWPRRAAATPSFILRETVSVPGTAPVEGSAVLEPVRTGLLAEEIRWVPGAAAGVSAIEAAGDARLAVVVNPLEQGGLVQVRGGRTSTLPGTEAVRANLRSLPAQLSVTYLVDGAGFAGILVAPVRPLRGLPPAAALLLFALIGAFAALAWREVLLPTIQRPAPRAPQPPAGPGADGQRTPLVPHRD